MVSLSSINKWCNLYIKRGIIISLSLSFCGILHGQNLIPNNSFENFSQCPFNSTIEYVNNWNTYVFNDYLTNYNNICNFSDSAPVQGAIPFNNAGGGGFQYPYNGDGYIGLELIKFTNSIYRSIPQVRLTKPLDSGQFYCYTMYLSLSDSSGRATDDFGVLFINVPLNLNTIDTFPEPQIVNHGTFLIDKVNWMKYEGLFKAVGGEEYMLIGCFSNYDELNIEILDSNLNLNAYYYIDNISLYECDSLIGVSELPYNLVSIYPNPAQDFASIDLPKSYNQASLSIFNLTGQLISQKQLTQLNQQIPITELGNGMYIFVIQNEDKVIGRQRVVISK